ncbi:MAG: leucyl aminopeptidase [Alphaproteobacteria bacterium]
MLTISFQAGSPENGVVATGVFAENQLTAFGKTLETRSPMTFQKAFEQSFFKGKPKEILSLLAPAPLALDQLFLVGLGEKKDLTEAKAYEVGGTLTATLQRLPHAKASVVLEDLDLETVLAIAFGAQLRAWRFDAYKTQQKPEEKSRLKELVFYVADPKKASEQFESLKILAESTHFSRRLISEPGNVIYPDTLAKEAETLKTWGVEVERLDTQAMKKLGMGALLGVAQGSAQEPYLVVMRWQGADSKAEAPVAFVGKGVTFDTGGISLKPSNNMEDMKGDMAGAAVVIGLMQALARRKAKVNAVGVVALVENMPSGTAQRPGDIVTSMSGQTIEVLNTDAEGRLILADALWYTQDRFNPKYIVDLATLTGAMRVALGDAYAGLFANDDTLAEQLAKAGEIVGEPLWRLPLAHAYDKVIDSPVADMKNIGTPGYGAGSITAAQFLQRFVNKKAWAHLDIAAVDMASKDTPLWAKGGGTAFGLRLLNRWVESLEQK